MKQKKTFAQRAKEIEKKFEGRNDKISLRTKEAMLADLREQQEALKATMEVPDTNQAFLGGLFGAVGGAAGAAGGVSSVMDPGLAQGLVDVGGGMTGVEGLMTKTPAADVSGAAGGGIGDALGKAGGVANSLLSAGQNIFGNADHIDDGGATHVDADAVKKQNTMGTIGGVAELGMGIASGDPTKIIGGVGKTIGGLFGAGKKATEKAVKAERNYDLAQSNKYRPSNYSNGGLVTDKPHKPLEPLPVHNDPDRQNELRSSWMARHKMSAEQLGGFEAQRESDNKWQADRDAFYKDQYTAWRAGKTGNSPNSKLSQTDPVYQKFWKDTKASWHKDNPRQVNDIVQGYAMNGPAGAGQGIEMGKQPVFDKTMFKNNEGVLASDYAYGGKVNQAALGDLLGRIFGRKDGGSKVGNALRSVFKPKENVIDYGQINNTIKNQGISDNASVYGADEVNYADPTVTDEDMKSPAGKVVGWLDENKGNILQYANLAGALTHKLEAPTTPRGTRLEGRANLDRLDEKSIINEIKASYNTSGAAKEGSGGNLAAYNALNLAGGANKTKAISAGRRAIGESNLAQDEKEVRLERQKNMTNMAADERFLEREAQDQGAYNTAKENRRAAIFQSLANIGREEGDKKIVKEMYGYKWDGKYYSDGKGNKLTSAEYENLLDKHDKAKSNMFGGYLKK